jgi:hypothetical protein
MRAGTNAPSQTIAMTMFHILNNPTTYRRLKKELFAAIPDVTATPNMDRLEQIPYLVCGGMIPYFSGHIGLISV